LSIRLQPPKTKKRSFKGVKEVSEYIFGHKAIGMDPEKTVSEFFEERMDFGWPFDYLMHTFLTLWPLEYQELVKELFTEKYFEDYSRRVSAESVK
jgi:hypothetical protein